VNGLCVAAGISGVKSREDLVMSNTDLSATATAADPFSAAPFKPPAGIVIVIIIIIENVLIRAGIRNLGRNIPQGNFGMSGGNFILMGNSKVTVNPTIWC